MLSPFFVCFLLVDVQVYFLKGNNCEKDRRIEEQKIIREEETQRETERDYTEERNDRKTYKS